MRCCIIYNPGSRNGGSRKYAVPLRRAMDAAGIEYEIRTTACQNDAVRFSREANLAGYDIIAAMGGDGTINRVLNGFYNEDGKRLSRAAFGVIYTGTSPDFCRSYGIPVEFDSAIKVLFQRVTCKISIGKIIYAPKFLPEYANRTTDNTDNFRTGYFACCANIGIGASIARYANGGIRKLAGDTAGTFTALIRSLIKYRPSDFRVICDGEEKIITKMHSLSVGRTRYIASGIKVDNELTPYDSRFYNLQINNMGIRQVPATLRTIYCGNKIDGRAGACSLSYSAVLDICGNLCNPEIEFDGDPAGFLPCRIEAAAEPLDLITGARQ
jgi:diacylglycerol kinase (ATP)